MVTTDTLPRLLAALRVGLHVMFAFLLVFGVARTLADDSSAALIVFASGAMGAVYLAGTVVERRRLLAGRGVSRTWAHVWLGVITGLWILLVSTSPNFVWLEFPLVFLSVYLLSPPWRYLAPAALWIITVLAPTWPAGEGGAGVVIGPAFGTLFAVGIAIAYAALRREAERYRDIAKRLEATQQQLVAAEHQAGRLEERERLAREIHDTLAQGFSSLVLFSRAAKNSLDDREKLTEQLDTIHAVASENLAEARRFVRDLNEHDETLTERLERLVASMRRRGRALGEETEFELNTFGEVSRLPDAVASAVVRVTQEGLNNVVKHAAARRAAVTVGVFADTVTVDVVDDGQGMREDVRKDSFGLQGLERRIAKLGGSVTLAPGPGPADRPGTALTAQIPLGGDQRP